MTVRGILLVTVLWAAATTGWCASAYIPPVVSAPLLSKAPQIDGNVEPAEWAQAAVLSDFVRVGGEALPGLRTTVYVAYDATSFYLAAVCTDPEPTMLCSMADKRDGAVREDDSIEIVIDTVGERKNAAHLAINVANVQFDSWDDDATQDFKWESATSQGETGWSAEVAMPFARGIGPAVGDSWLINVARFAAGRGERSSWAPVAASLGELDRLGPLVFSGAPFRVIQRPREEAWLGQNLAQFEVSSWRPGAANLAAKLNARVEGTSRTELYMEKITVGSQPTIHDLPYKVSGDGTSYVTFALTIAGPQDSTIVAWRSAPYPIQTPPVTAELTALESTLSDTLLTWKGLPEGERKARLQVSLAEILAAWEGLAQQAQVRQGKGREEYGHLLLQVQMLRQTALGLQSEVRGG